MGFQNFLSFYVTRQINKQISSKRIPTTKSCYISIFFTVEYISFRSLLSVMKASLMILVHKIYAK